MGGKMAPRPSLSANRSRIQAAADSSARRRTGPRNGSARLYSQSTPRKKLVQLKSRRVGGDGQRGVAAGSTKSSAIPLFGGRWRTGLYAEKMLRGTTIVRVQLDIA